jgi:nitrile hydratase accessory protein
VTDVDSAVSGMDGVAALPRRNGELAFDEPWQGRVFGTALAVVQEQGLDWDEFRERLITAIDEDPERPYWESWLAALEVLLADLDIAG